MKHIHVFCITLLALATACKHITTEFTYTPQHPKAGETVTFINTSYGGEDWSWNFGDNATSTNKSPNHAYKKAGSYTVTLTASYKSQSKTYVSTIEVVDSVPGFAVGTDSILIFEPVTLTAGVWNPFDYPIAYQWTLDSTSTVLVQGTTTDKQISVYFTRHSTSIPVRLEVTLGKETYPIEQQLFVHDQPAVALLMLHDGSAYRQRLFTDNRVETPSLATYPEANTLLSLTPDTVDRLGRKLYYRSHGLYVANANGSDPVQICSDEVSAFMVDGADNRLYWATAEGVWRMPLVQTSNNHFAFIPERMNTLGMVTKMAKDNTPR